MTWKPASAVFQPGTAGIRALVGRRVRTAATIAPNEYRGDGLPMGGPVSIARGREGFVANPLRDDLLIAFPDVPPPAGMTLEQMARTGRFKTVLVNAPTFGLQFEVDA